MNDKISGLQNPIIRGRILSLIATAHETGLGGDIIEKILTREGFEVEKQDVANALSYLENKNLIRTKDFKYMENKRRMAYILPEGIDIIEGTRSIEGIEL